MKKNHGFTLVEVMVTVAVMGVLASIAGITIGVLLRQRVKSMAADTKSIFQSTQMVAYTRADAYIKLTQDGGKAIVTAYTGPGEENDTRINQVEGRSITMSYKVAGTNNFVPVPAGGIEIHFDRQTGGISTATGVVVSELKLQQGQKTIILHISKLTGKVTY